MATTDPKKTVVKHFAIENRRALLVNLK